MARQVLETQPWRKLFETYQDFSGGLNVMDANEKLKDSELVELVNVELGERGSLKRRTGYNKHLPSPFLDGLNPVQGYFRYFFDNGTYHELVAIDGKLYNYNYTGSTWEELVIENLSSFQSQLSIEAVQVKEKLYIATGTKLVQYDGTTASVVVPKKPDALEALYVGTNGLADDPDNYLTDGESAFLQIEGVTADKRYGMTNRGNGTKFSAFVSKPLSSTIEYKFEHMHESSTTWSLSKDWNTSNYWDAIFSKTGIYQIKASARIQGTTDVEEYTIPNYTVYETDKNENEPYIDIHTCKRIMLHWGRLFLYNGMDSDLVYISHLNEPDYFPTTNTIRFENEWREGITNIVQYRDMLVIFSPSTIQALFGKSPDDYRRVLLNSSLGCISPQAARVVGNHIIFHSNDGFYLLKSVGTVNDRANVEKIDTKIHDLVPNDAHVACAVVYDNQYIVYFGDTKQAFRYYYEYGVWVTDQSERLDIKHALTFNGELYVTRYNGDVLKKSVTSYKDDDYIFEMKIASKYYTFGQPYHMKKLKEILLVLGHFNVDVSANLYVYADVQLIVNPLEEKAVVNEEGVVEWQVTNVPNLKAQAGTVFGGWKMGESPFGSQDASVKELKVSGKCRKTKVVITHTENTPFQLIGLGYIFKAKQP